MNLNYNVRYKEGTSILSTDSVYVDDGTGILKKVLFPSFTSSITNSYVEKTVNYTITSSDSFVNCIGTFNISLPTATTIIGKQFSIINSGNGVITIIANGTETIGNYITSSTFTINSDEVLTIISDGSNFKII